MGGEKREGNVKKIAARCHGSPDRDDASILWQETRRKDYSRSVSFKQSRRLHQSQQSRQLTRLAEADVGL
jgi:hypothetical protein